MRAGFVYAAICVSIAAFSQVDAKTVTEYRTVTTTEYRDRTPTNTAVVDEKPNNEISPEVKNGGGVVSNTETLPPKPTTTGSKKTGKPGKPVKPTQDTKSPTNTAVPTGSTTDTSLPTPPVGTGSAPVTPPAGTMKPGNQIHKVSSAAGHSSAKSSATASAAGFDFSPMTLAPESSLTHKPTQLREMTASKQTGAAATGAESTSAGRSTFYGMSYATVAGMTVLGMVASTLVL